MKKFVVFLLLFFFCSVKAWSMPTNSIVSDFFANTQNITLHFEQTKSIPDIEKPFQSSGVFQFVKNKGFIVKQEKPHTQKFVSTTERYCFDDKNEELKKLPYFSDIKIIIDDLLSGDMDKLEQIFDIAYLENTNSWQIILTPTQNKMKEFISKIKLTGNETQITNLVIEYTDDTKINVDFSIIEQDLTNEIHC